MALNTWWDADAGQRYWMEIATGETGELLQAPKFPGATWSYDLVGQVRLGDRVLHWRSGVGRGFVGWSEVVGDVRVVPQYTWQPRGTAGRALPGPRTTEGWVAPLGGLHPFPTTLTSDDIQRLSAKIFELDRALDRSHGEPTYFPFYLYGGRQVRAQQGYLVKFPVELFDVIPGLDAARERVVPDPDDELPEDGQPRRKPAPRGRVTRVQDPVLRLAIERRSVDVAKAHYFGLGAREEDVVELGKPYDLRVQLDGVERHVEVKGSSMLVSTVELTINEVEHGRAHGACDLVVVDGIEWKRQEDGSVNATGGTLRAWTDWTPSDDDLSARKFAYNLPPLD